MATNPRRQPGASSVEEILRNIYDPGYNAIRVISVPNAAEPYTSTSTTTTTTTSTSTSTTAT